MLGVVLGLVFLVACEGGSPASAPPVNAEGAIDLSDRDFGRGDAIPLTGPWEFYWSELIPPGEFSERDLAGRVELPHEWGDDPEDASTPYGRATYRLRFLLSESHSLRGLALHLPSIRSAYRLYLNGDLIAVRGALNQDGEGEPLLLRQTVSLPSLLPENELVLQVANLHTRKGGVLQPIELGLASGLLRRELSGIVFETLMAGALAMMAVYFFGVSLGIRREASAFWLAVLCAVVALRTGLVGDKVLVRLFLESNGALAYRLEFLTLPLMILSAILLVHSLFPKDALGPPLWGFGALFLAYMSLIVFAPIRLFTAILPYFQIVGLVVPGLYIVFILGRAIHRRRTGSRLMLVSMGLAFSIGMGSILKLYFDTSALQAVIVMLGFAFLLTLRFARALVQVERLSAEMQRKNQSLKKLDRLKDEFLANTSHELRTPLNGIIGITESLLAGAGGAIAQPVKNNLELVAASGRRLINLINDILDLSKLRHGDFVVHPVAVDLRPLIEAVTALSRPLIGEKPVNMRTEIQSDLPDVLVDRDRIEQVLHNLVGNAIKFTKEGLITVRAVRSSDFADRVVVSIADTGIGIPPEKFDVIFDAFSQADGSISREFGGTGLGLGISRQLVELHCGRLEVQSAPGRGSVFSFTLPVAFAESGDRSEKEARPVAEPIAKDTPDMAGEQGSAPVVAEAEAAGGEAVAPLRILVVDDDPVNLQVLRNHLLLNGHQIVSASDGRVALRQFEEHGPFDLILLDVMMPGLSGYEVCRILREQYSSTELPIIMLTARDRMNDLLMGFESGANDYLTKPFDGRELLARVRTMAALKQSARAQSDLAALQSELTMAHTLQQSLLPRRIPEYPGLKIAVRYQAMQNVGGDFYDFRPDENGIGVLIADVSGHGVSAALIVSMVKIAFWLQKQDLRAPDQIFAGMNRILCENVESSFVTACYAYVDPVKKVLVTSNAGHPPLLLWRKKEQRLLSLRPAGRPFGFFGSAEYDMTGTSLVSGDRLFLFTDGLYEMANEKLELFGEPRLEAAIQEHQDLDPQQHAGRIFEAAFAWAGGPEKLTDDIALAIIDIE